LSLSTNGYLTLYDFILSLPENRNVKLIRRLLRQQLLFHVKGEYVSQDALRTPVKNSEEGYALLGQLLSDPYTLSVDSIARKRKRKQKCLIYQKSFHLKLDSVIPAAV
jgi:hypothetical protein